MFREQNTVADWFVGDEERIVLVKPPFGCNSLVQNDWIGGVAVRSVHETDWSLPLFLFGCKKNPLTFLDETQVS